MIYMSAEIVLGAVGTAISAGVAFLVYWFDRRRRNEADAGHRAVIHANLRELHGMVVQIMLNVRDMETDDEGVVAERLDDFLTGKRSRMEGLIDEIRWRQAHILKPAHQERENIGRGLAAVRWILDTYCPDNVPRANRPNLWKRQHKTLRQNATVIAELGQSHQPPAPP